MKNIIAFFTNKIVIAIIGLSILSALIWFMGPSLKFGEQNNAPLAPELNRIMAILIISLLWGMNYLRVQLLEKKNNNLLVNDLQQPQDNSGDFISDQSSDEMLQMNERFTQALSTLKKLNFKGKGAKAALYELPWYIIIGPPGSGKTTALINSSLDFPLAEQFGKGALQGVGGSRICDWWFTNDAVLIDTAGRYTTQDSHKVIDSSAWTGFLKLLKKHRRRRPINGAIVAISLQELLMQTEDERAKHAKLIRTRIDELMEKLEVRFPVYLMFTKCDLVSGFSEFFEDLGKEEREQVLGISLPDAPEPTQAPNFDKLSVEYRKIIKGLYDRVLWRVHSERDTKRRSAIQGFPQQMENLQPLMDSFVQQTFAQNRFSLQPYLRGVYFTSGTQDGTPIDRLMSAVSSNFGFAGTSVNAPMQQGKSYFLGKLFKDVIFPEAELVGSNRFYEKVIKWTQRIAYTTMATVSAGLLFFWTGAITQHESYMNDVVNYVDEYQSELSKQNKWSTDIRQVLPALNALAKASIVYDQEESPWVDNFGMYDNNVDEAANEAYLDQLSDVFYPKLITYLELHLKNTQNDDGLYKTFRTYVMFNKLDHMDKKLVKEWFVNQWNTDFPKESDNKQALSAHLNTLLATELSPAKLNKHIVTASRQRLLRMPIHVRIYQRLLTHDQYSQTVNVLNEMGGAVRDTYHITPSIERELEIPVLFTKTTYDALDFSENSALIMSIAKEKWLLQDDAKAEVDFVGDNFEEIGEKVKTLYLSDYNKYWQKVYNALQVKPTKGIMQMSHTLSTFADPVYSPIVAILNVTASNTQLTNQMVANLADDSSGVAGKLANAAANKVDLTSVDKKYRKTNLLLRETSKQAAPINTALLKISQMQEMLNTINLAPDPNLEAFKMVNARYQNGTANAITALNAYAKSAPKPLKKWLTSLADETWRVVLNSAHQHIKNEWRDNVYRPYMESLVGRYPIEKSADNDIALFDFVGYFKPAGQMDTFYLTYIKPFINTRKGWSNKTIDKYNLGLSSRTLEQVQRALEIKEVLFRQNPESPSLSFSLKPSVMPKNNVRFMLEVGSERVTYSHGPKFWKTLKWSANNERNRVRIVFEDLNEQQHSKTFEGPWAWLRLLDESKLTKSNESSTYVVTYAIEHRSDDDNLTSDNKQQISYLIKAKSVKNPFEKQLLSLFKCPETI